ncbi:MAG: Quinolinate synthase [Rhodobacteraceae bacterium HLUCCA12]|nr:MAG: Quinolinate synthase [Rhodobacteraceae bacterium HLUCCA12]
MGRIPGFRGVYAVAWAQTELGDERGLPPDLMSVGLPWSWHGRAWRLDTGPETLWLDRPVQPADPRGRARDRLRRLAFAPAAAEQALDLSVSVDDDLPADSFTLTDGHALYHARILRQPGRLLAVFDPLMPPPGRVLWITALNLAPRGPKARSGVICFLPGTRIDTPDGPRPVERLEPGDRVVTRDNGDQPLVWCGATHLTGAELYLHPHLRPVRICAGALAAYRAGAGALPDADLLVSPEHRVLLRGADDLFGTPEVLACAADLEDGRRIRRDFAPSSVTYVHLMFERHQIITANGLPCESFHPALAGAEVLKWHARALERAMPGLVEAPGRLGPPARRCLDTAEARMLLHGAARTA